MTIYIKCVDCGATIEILLINENGILDGGHCEDCYEKAIQEAKEGD